MCEPLFSVITVSFNSEKTILRTLKSVDAQTYQNFEHIIIDGGSSDSTMNILKLNKSVRRHVYSEPDLGIYHAMNKGLKKVRGKYIAILNSDDYFSNKNILNDVVKTMELNSANIVFSGISYVNQYGLKTSEWLPTPFSKGSYKFGFNTPHPGFFADRSVYEELGNFDTSMQIAADFDLMFRFMEHPDVRCKRLNQIMVVMQSDGKSSSLLSVLQGMRDIIRSFKKNSSIVWSLTHFLIRYTFKIKRILTNKLFYWKTPKMP